jgi:hypothetical protein
MEDGEYRPAVSGSPPPQYPPIPWSLRPPVSAERLKMICLRRWLRTVLFLAPSPILPQLVLRSPSCLRSPVSIPSASIPFKDPIWGEFTPLSALFCGAGSLVGFPVVPILLGFSGPSARSCRTNKIYPEAGGRRRWHRTPSTDRRSVVCGVAGLPDAEGLAALSIPAFFKPPSVRTRCRHLVQISRRRQVVVPS